MYKGIQIKDFYAIGGRYPLQLVMFSSDNKSDPEWRKHHKIVILINNGIHPGEPMALTQA